jgi:hypothetical protein
MTDQLRTVEVKLDPEMHPEAVADTEVKRLTWEVLDTVWKLLQEYSVRVTLAEIRSQLTESGDVDVLPSDEELFAGARESGDPDAPLGYMDLAPSNEVAGRALQMAFDALVADAFLDAATGMGFAVEEQPDADQS